MNTFIKLTTLALALTISGCNAIRPMLEAQAGTEPRVSQPMLKELVKVPAPAGPPITVAVYSFKDDWTAQAKQYSKFIFVSGHTGRRNLSY